MSQDFIIFLHIIIYILLTNCLQALGIADAQSATLGVRVRKLWRHAFQNGRQRLRTWSNLPAVWKQSDVDADSGNDTDITRTSSILAFVKIELLVVTWFHQGPIKPRFDPVPYKCGAPHKFSDINVQKAIQCNCMQSFAVCYYLISATAFWLGNPSAWQCHAAPSERINVAARLRGRRMPENVALLSDILFIYLNCTCMHNIEV